jgi:hypothetical protein
MYSRGYRRSATKQRDPDDWTHCPSTSDSRGGCTGRGDRSEGVVGASRRRLIRCSRVLTSMIHSKVARATRHAEMYCDAVIIPRHLERIKTEETRFQIVLVGFASEGQHHARMAKPSSWN